MKTIKKLRTIGIILGTLLAVVLLASCTVPVELIPPTAGDLYPDTAQISAPVQGKASLDVKIVTFGRRYLPEIVWSFAILSDVHVVDTDDSILQQALTQIAGMVKSYNIRFVMVLGDLVQGEKATENAYRTEFNLVKTDLDNFQTTYGIPYIPLIGNHDIWCNLSDGDITLPDGTTIVPRYTSTVYPEEIFNEVFGPQYVNLENLFEPNWWKQAMPDEGLDNPDYTVPTYLQNFAFDYGSYHFVCLDFCARDDFNPPDWDFNTNLPSNLVDPPYAKCQFGYASLLSQYEGDSTITWLHNHLSTYTGNKNTFFFSHHPPVFELYSIPFAGFYCHMVDHNTFGFNETDYDTLVSDISGLATSYNLNYWLTGHYHETELQWVDTGIGPPTPVKVIPSVKPDKWQLLSGTVTINGAYNVNPLPNSNGYITVFKFFVCPWLPVVPPGGYPV